MIIGFFGNVRQGKTYSAVIELKKLYDRGYNIYSNTPLSFKYIPLTIELLLDIIENDLDIKDNAVFFIDEIHVFGLDSRSSMSKRNKVISYFLLQTGKMNNSEKASDFGLILIYTSQFTHLIDKRLKSVTDIAIECEKINYKGSKFFKLTKHFFKGVKSFSVTNLIKGTQDNYDLYDTKARIKVQKDRYEKE